MLCAKAVVNGYPRLSSHQRREPGVALDLVHVLPAKPRGRLAHERHHEVHALGTQFPHHVVRDIEELPTLRFGCWFGFVGFIGYTHTERQREREEERRERQTQRDTGADRQTETEGHAIKRGKGRRPNINTNSSRSRETHLTHA